jgi:hypothetical protein
MKLIEVDSKATLVDFLQIKMCGILNHHKVGTEKHSENFKFIYYAQAQLGPGFSFFQFYQ